MATNPGEEMSDLFDQIDDLLDLLEEEEEEVEKALVMVKKPCNETGAFLLPPLTPPPPPVTSATAAGDEILESSSNQKQFDEQLDYWTPAFHDECGSFLADIELPGAAAGVAKIDAFFRDSSPISVLLVPAANCSGESSSSSYSSNSASHTGGRPFSARARSNRRCRRPTAFYLPPPRSHSANESFGESESSPAPKKKKKIKFTTKRPAAGTEDKTGSPPPAAAVGKCAHCGTQKTPQWRAGPTGPKTLCNACGVRYNTGRLFPEYRPAASPTFVPALHSNSHKKVVEMRMKAVGQAAGSSSSGTGPDDGCDLLQYIRRRR